MVVPFRSTSVRPYGGRHVPEVARHAEVPWGGWALNLCVALTNERVVTGQRIVCAKPQDSVDNAVVTMV